MFHPNAAIRFSSLANGILVIQAPADRWRQHVDTLDGLLLASAAEPFIVLNGWAPNTIERARKFEAEFPGSSTEGAISFAKPESRLTCLAIFGPPEA